MSESNGPPANPYDSMKDDNIRDHLEQIAKVLDGRKIDIDLYKVFSLQKEENAVSDEDKVKIEEHAKFSAMVQQIREAVGVQEGDVSVPKETPIDPNVERVAKMQYDSTVREIKEIDGDFPIDEVIGGSNRSIFDKIEIASGLKKVAEYNKKSLDGLRSTIGNTSDGNVDRASFSAPSSSSFCDVTKGMQSMIDDALGAFNKEAED